jgi:hypothetical protein
MSGVMESRRKISIRVRYLAAHIRFSDRDIKYHPS